MSNQIYCFNKEKDKLENIEVEKKEDLLLLDHKNPKNYVVSCIYPNGMMEQVLRSKDLESHAESLKKLLLASKYLKKYMKESQIEGYHHLNADISLAENKIMSLFYYCSNEEEHGFVAGYLNVPYHLTKMQKNFLQERFCYFEMYDFLSINQYITKIRSFEELTMKDENFMRVLRKLVQK